MKYYKFTSYLGEVKLAAVPTEELLFTAMRLVFRDKEKGLPFKDVNGGFQYTETDSNIEKSNSVKSVEEISQDEYRHSTGTSHMCSCYAKRDCYFKEDLPEDWLQKAMSTLTSGGWANQFGWENDLSKVVDGEIDSLELLNLMWNNMFGLDPILELEALDRWLYGTAIESEKHNKDLSEIAKIKRENKQMHSFLIDCHYKIWVRHTVEITSENYEKAKERAIELAKNHPVSLDDGEQGVEVSLEPLYDTEKLVEPTEDYESVQVMTNESSPFKREILYKNK